MQMFEDANEFLETKTIKTRSGEIALTQDTIKLLRKVVANAYDRAELIRHTPASIKVVPPTVEGWRAFLDVLKELHLVPESYVAQMQDMIRADYWQKSHISLSDPDSYVVALFFGLLEAWSNVISASSEFSARSKEWARKGEVTINFNKESNSINFIPVLALSQPQVTYPSQDPFAAQGATNWPFTNNIVIDPKAHTSVQPPKWTFGTEPTPELMTLIDIISEKTGTKIVGNLNDAEYREKLFTRINTLPSDEQILLPLRVIETARSGDTLDKHLVSGSYSLSLSDLANLGEKMLMKSFLLPDRYIRDMLDGMRELMDGAFPDSPFVKGFTSLSEDHPLKKGWTSLTIFMNELAKQVDNGEINNMQELQEAFNKILDEHDKFVQELQQYFDSKGYPKGSGELVYQTLRALFTIPVMTKLFSISYVPQPPRNDGAGVLLYFYNVLYALKENINRGITAKTIEEQYKNDDQVFGIVTAIGERMWQYRPEYVMRFGYIAPGVSYGIMPVFSRLDHLFTHQELGTNLGSRLLNEILWDVFINQLADGAVGAANLDLQTNYQWLGVIGTTQKGKTSAFTYVHKNILQDYADRFSAKILGDADVWGSSNMYVQHHKPIKDQFDESPKPVVIHLSDEAQWVFAAFAGLHELLLASDKRLAIPVPEALKGLGEYLEKDSQRLFMSVFIANISDLQVALPPYRGRIEAGKVGHLGFVKTDAHSDEDKEEKQRLSEGGLLDTKSSFVQALASTTPNETQEEQQETVYHNVKIPNFAGVISNLMDKTGLTQWLGIEGDPWGDNAIKFNKLVADKIYDAIYQYFLGTFYDMPEDRREEEARRKADEHFKKAMQRLNGSLLKNFTLKVLLPQVLSGRMGEIYIDPMMYAVEMSMDVIDALRTVSERRKIKRFAVDLSRGAVYPEFIENTPHRQQGGNSNADQQENEETVGLTM